tara:strand:- start:44 stop:760 length:717 start_codon:yes stop_codon:yes gene_type:complete
LSFLKDCLFTEKGFELTKRYTVPRVSLGLGKYASYKDFDDSYWRIGYGSIKIKDHYLNSKDKATQLEIDNQFKLDLEEFAKIAEQYIFIPLNKNRKAALLSFAHSVGIQSFKTCRLLNLINESKPKSKIIKEWSPTINTIWRSGGDLLIDRRRVELNTYYAPDKKIPTFYPHKCSSKVCLLNLAETYNGSPSQIKGIEYLEKKLKILDPSGQILRRFFRYWNQKPTGLGSLQPPTDDL